MKIPEAFVNNSSHWQTRLAAAAFLGGLEVEDLALEQSDCETLLKIMVSLKELPWSYAKEVCYEVMRGKETDGREFRASEKSSTGNPP